MCVIFDILQLGARYMMNVTMIWDLVCVDFRRYNCSVNLWCVKMYSRCSESEAPYFAAGQLKFSKNLSRYTNL